MRGVPAQSNFAVAMYFAFKVIPAFGGILAIYLGYNLFILGVTGQASLSLNSKEVGGQLLNAAPGLFFAVGGIATLIAVVWKGVKVEFTPQRKGAKRPSEPRSFGKS